MNVFLIIIFVIIAGAIILAIQQNLWFHWPGKIPNNSDKSFTHTVLDEIIKDMVTNPGLYTFSGGTSSQFLRKINDKDFLMGPNWVLIKPFKCVPTEAQKIKLKKLLIKIRSNDSFAVNQYRHPHGRY